MGCFPKRYTIAILSFLGMMLVSVLQSAFTFAYQKMTEEEGQRFKRGNSAAYDSALSAYTVAFLPSFVGGILSHRYGGATITGIGVALSAFINVMTPFTVHAPAGSLTLIKFLDGLVQAISYCGIADIWTRWYPFEERSKIVAFVLTGSYAGLIFHRRLFEMIVRNWSWRAVFGISGTFTASWAIIWLTVVRSDPAKDETLSKDERELLSQRLKYLDNCRTFPTKLEWKQIFASAPIWTLLFSTFVFICGSNMFHGYLPRYAKREVFMDHVTEEKLPIVINIFIVTYLLVAGYLADYGRDTKFTTTKIHKLIICSTFSVGALLLVAYTIIPRLLNVVTFFGVYELSRSFAEISIFVNAIDLAPKYVSLIYGIQRSVLSLGALVSSGFIDFMLSHYQRAVWNICFISFAVMYLCGAVFYYFFGSGELQQCNCPRVEVHELKRRENDTTV